jgi:hypothetical protein
LGNITPVAGPNSEPIQNTPPNIPDAFAFEIRIEVSSTESIHIIQPIQVDEGVDDID